MIAGDGCWAAKLDQVVGRWVGADDVQGSTRTTVTVPLKDEGDELGIGIGAAGGLDVGHAVGDDVGLEVGADVELEVGDKVGGLDDSREMPE